MGFWHWLADFFEGEDDEGSYFEEDYEDSAEYRERSWDDWRDENGEVDYDAYNLHLDRKRFNDFLEHNEVDETEL